MDFKSALGSIFNAASNVTSETMRASETSSAGPNSGQSSKNPLLDSLAPLLGGQYSPLIRSLTVFDQLFGYRFGIDPTMLLALIGTAWALNRMWRQLYGTVASFTASYFMSTIAVASGDEIYTHLMKWLAVHPLATTSRSLMAETVTKTAWEEDEELEALQMRKIAGGGDTKYFNFSNQQAKARPRFVPAVGLHGFWHEGRYYRLNRRQQSVIDDSGSSRGFEKEEVLVISCFGRSTTPIKNLLQAVKHNFYADHVARTTIKRPASTPLRRYNGRNWQTVAVRPVRPLSTVVLDPVQKSAVLSDLNEYLHPATPRWYANRGIPLRRGYLFHGPPGTGKTSLSFALAGVFGLDIFVISLLEPTITEEDLGLLFGSLPRRCVVLLEDIDTAGLTRATEDEKEKEKNKEKDSDEESEEEGGKDIDSDDETEQKHGKGEVKDAQKNGTPAKSEGKGKYKGKKGTDAGAPATNGVVNGTEAPTKPAETSSKRASQAARKKSGKKRDDWKVSDLARALKREAPVPEERKGISLSGLLNAIDGVASQEGRVLVMTTNRPEELDDALIRPGRVDLQVGFSNATSLQARELFERMYEADSSPTSTKSLASKLQEQAASKEGGEGQNGKPVNGTSGGHEKIVSSSEDVEKEVNTEDLKRIAAEFGSKVPDGMLSPAEIQGFLLKRKKDPERALRETDVWVEAMKAQKESKTKILTVQ